MCIQSRWRLEHWKCYNLQSTKKKLYMHNSLKAIQQMYLKVDWGCFVPGTFQFQNPVIISRYRNTYSITHLYHPLANYMCTLTSGCLRFTIETTIHKSIMKLDANQIQLTRDRFSITDETKFFIDKMSQQSPDESPKAIDITGDDSDSDHGMINCWVKIDKINFIYMIQTGRYSRIVKHGLMIL